MRRFTSSCFLPRVLAVAVVIAAFIAAFGAGTARAAGDNSIESSNPSEGEVVTVAPTQIQLRFKNPVGGAEAVAKMGLSLSCESKLTNLGPPQLAADGVTVSAALTQIPDNGSCTVSWSLSDGSTGSFKFISQAQATTTTSSTLPTGNTVPVQPGGTTFVEPRLGGPVGLMRWIVFFAVSAVFGGILLVRTVWPEGIEYGITERYLRQVAIIAVVSLYVLAALMNARETGGSIAASFSPTEWGPLLGTNEGRAVVLRLLSTGVLGYFCWITSRIFDPEKVVPLTIALIVTILTYGFDRTSGRAVAIGILLAVVHMAATAWWVGSIAMVWRVVLHGPGEVDLVHALRGWSRLANPVAIVVIVSGAMQAYRLDNLSLVNSGHGRLVILKFLMVAVMLFVGSVVRQFILRGMQRAASLNQKVVYRLKRPVGIELSLSIAVLAASSWLMAMRPPYVILPSKGPVTEYAIVQDLTGKDDFHVRISITPGNVGPNRVLVELFGPKRVQNLTVALTPVNTGFSGYSLYVPITRPGGALVGEDAGMQLRAPGQWNIEVTAVSTVGDLDPLKGSFIIADGVTVTTVPRAGSPGTTNSTSVVPAGVTTTTSTTTTLPAG